jgi:hypothetical protein
MPATRRSKTPTRATSKETGRFSCFIGRGGGNLRFVSGKFSEGVIRFSLRRTENIGKWYPLRVKVRQTFTPVWCLERSEGVIVRMNSAGYAEGRTL